MSDKDEKSTHKGQTGDKSWHIGNRDGHDRTAANNRPGVVERQERERPWIPPPPPPKKDK